MLAVSAEDLSNAGYAARALGFPFPVLYDLPTDVVKLYDVFNSSTGHAVPSTFIIDAQGVIRWEFIGSTYHRAPMSEIIAQLQRLS